jgi:VIT1/CCC1 family predicted Fe2+/Mn2+ transporter
MRNAIDLEASELRDRPEEEFAEQVAYYRAKGFTLEEAQLITRRLVQNRELWLYEMVRDEFGIDPRIVEEGGGRASLAIAASFAGGAFVPVLPYLLPIDFAAALIVGLLLAAAGLFAIGYYSGRLSGRNAFAKGAEIVAYGMGVFLISYAVGRYVPPLFGHTPITS